ncbi:hypothetical protein [Nonomuraea rosea]|uniref:hypothetical protein n=1 Tax=Nonomuraea rosea TaxID=638574 RepID=UPI0031EA9EB7
MSVLPSSKGVAWGAAVLNRNRSYDGYTYIYGVEDVHEGPIEAPTAVYKYLHVARVHGSDLRLPWQYLDVNGDWMPEESFTTRQYLVGSNGAHVPVSNEFSVDDNGRLVTQDSSVAFSGEIYLYKGCSVSGPFGGKTFLYKTTEGGPWGDYGNGNLYTYNAKAHDFVLDDASGSESMIISYNMNSLDWHDVYRDIRWYQPRFIKVVLKR